MTEMGQENAGSSSPYEGKPNMDALMVQRLKNVDEAIDRAAKFEGYDNLAAKLSPEFDDGSTMAGLKTSTHKFYADRFPQLVLDSLTKAHGLDAEDDGTLGEAKGDFSSEYPMELIERRIEERIALDREKLPS